MEAAFMSAMTGAMKPVMGKLAALMGAEYNFLKEVRQKITFLADELADLHVFLLNMLEEEEPDAQDKEWLIMVREVSYDMEDSIDDFMKSVDEKDANLYALIEKIKNSIDNLGKLKMHRRIGKEIQDQKRQIIEVGDMNERYKVGIVNGSYKSGVVISSSQNATVDPRALDICEHASELIGIDESKAELVKMLNEDNISVSRPQQPRIVSIGGPRGMDKTTLADQVYRELKWQYPCRAFLSVSRNPNMMDIMSTLFTDVSKQYYADTKAGSLKHLIGKINDYLVGQRYIIVVDDIWNVETWEVIKCIFPTNSRHSIIIITTCMSDVADSCCSSFNGHVHNIRPLGMVHSRQLFHRRLFNSEERCPSYLEDSSNEILKICDGLPLAIIVISGLLASKEKTVDIWNQVRDSIGRALEINHSVDSMMKILSFTYFDLPSHLKSCLLYMGIFPKGTIIEKECLIMRWVAEGFIYREGTYTVYELGEMCFNDLVNRSLIQLVNEEYHKPNSCRVNVTIHDFIISKSTEENFVTLPGVPFVPIDVKRKVRRLSLQVGTHRNSILPIGDLVLSHVRSLNVFGKTREIPPLDKFKYLRIMDFGSSCSLSYEDYELMKHHVKNIGMLLHLRYLNLGVTRISELPQDIGYLQWLETMDLRGSMVRVLPESLVNLGKLVNLLTDRNVAFPDGIVKVQSLEVLHQVSVFKQSFNFMQELGHLMNLRMMCIDFSEDKYMNLEMMCFHFEEDSTDEDTRDETEWEEPIASCFRGLVSLNNLHSLEIVGGSRFLPSDNLCPVPPSLRRLIFDQSLSKVPEWMPTLINLQELHIDVERITHNDLCIFGSLPALLKLELAVRHCNSEDTILIISSEVGFPCLTEFQYRTPRRGMDLKFAAGSMPKLQKLVFFTGSPYASQSDTFGFDFGIINLPRLITLKCKISGHYRCFEAATKSAASTHPNRPTVIFLEKFYL